MTAPLRKLLSKDSIFKGDEESDTSFQNLAEELAKTHTGKLTKNLTRKHVTENEAGSNGDDKVETGSGSHTHDDPHHGTNKEAATGIGDNEDKTGNNSGTHNDSYYSTHGAPSKGHNEEEQERQEDNSGKDIQVKRVIHVKTETGNGDCSHDDSQHGDNNEAMTSIGDNKAENGSGNRGGGGTREM